MSEEQIAAQINADAGICKNCPFMTENCQQDGCVIPVTNAEDYGDPYDFSYEEEE